MMMEGFSMTTMRNESEREDRFVPALGWRGGKELLSNDGQFVSHLVNDLFITVIVLFLSLNTFLIFEFDL